MKEDKIIIHCTYTPPDMDVSAKDIDRWHKERGWSGCGYHFVIKRDGTVEKGRPVGTMGAHARGYNKHIGIALVGGAKRLEDGMLDDECNFNFKQYESLEYLIEELSETYATRYEVLGHCDLPNTEKTCPNFNASEFARGIMEQ